METAFAVKDKKDKIKSYIGIIREITQTKIAEDQLQKYVSEIASANKKLYESQIELKNLNASKDKFFSIISHDLRAPFTSLIGLTDLLTKESGEFSREEIIAYVSKINKSARNVYNLLENLLEWSRVQTGRIEYNPVEFELFSIVDQCLSLLNNNAVDKKIVLTSSVLPGINVFADVQMITSVFQNLISNAIKFTNPGGRIEISSGVKDNMVEVLVTDNGVGISKKEIVKLFKIDVHHTTKGTANEKGTGLGLILCKEFVEKNGGEIRIESKLGNGTKFIFTIPRSKGAV